MYMDITKKGAWLSCGVSLVSSGSGSKEKGRAHFRFNFLQSGIRLCFASISFVDLSMVLAPSSAFLMLYSVVNVA